MVILARAMAVTQLNTEISGSQIAEQLQSFQDREQIAAWAEQAAALSAKYGIIEGSSGHANPQAHITRAEAAAVIKRLLEKSGLI
ncbi:Endo-1,4-beta-xylanase A precursor [compost metagenome]